MFFHYITLAFRNIFRNKVYSFITIFGFALGLSAAYMASTIVDSMINIDQDHKRRDDLYMVVYDKFQNGESTWKTLLNFASVKEAMKQEFPQVENIARINSGYSKLSYEGQFFNNRTFFVDTNIFSMINFEIIKGSKTHILQNPTDVLISETLSKKMFGDADPLGKTIGRNNDEEFRVSGVYKVPERSYFTHAMALFPYQHMGADMQNDWGGYKVHTMVLLKPHTNVPNLDKQLTPFVRRHRPKPSAGIKEELHLVKLTEIAYEEKILQKPYVVRKQEFYVFSLLIIVILGISSVNYVNLTIARSLERAKEVAIKKVVGATKSQLIIQFITESFIYNSISAVFALCLIVFGIPNINSWFYAQIPYFVPFQLDYSYLLGWTFWRVFTLVFLGGTIACAVYPALVISSFRAIDILKGKYKLPGKLKFNLRNSLLVFQFTVVIGLLLLTSALYYNARDLHSRPPSWTLNNHLIITNLDKSASDTIFNDRFNSIKNILSRHSFIKDITFSNSWPGQWVPCDYFNLVRLSTAALPDPKNYARVYVEFGFLESYKIPLKAGRYFSKSFTYDANSSVILNDTAAKQLGFKNPTLAVGKAIYVDSNLYTVVGILNYNSLPGNKPEPTLIFASNSQHINDGGEYSYTIAYEGKSEKDVKAIIEKDLKNIYPKSLMEINSASFYYYFNASYRSIDIKFFLLYSIIAILISCMGLYGLSSFVISRRTKEIGIRKVLGASLPQIIKLLSISFLRLIGLGIFIGSLVGAGLIVGIMKDLEKDGGTHATVAWWWFAIPAVLIFSLAALTVVVQTLSIAKSNPVDSLKSE